MEFALVLPLFLTLVLGTIDWGYYFFIDQIVVNAAREGARAGSVTDTSATGSTAVSNAETAANNYLTRFGLSSVCSGGSCASSLSGAADCGAAGVNCIQVDVSYPVGLSGSGSITGFLAPMLPDNAWARAVMRWQ